MASAVLPYMYVNWLPFLNEVCTVRTDDDVRLHIILDRFRGQEKRKTEGYIKIQPHLSSLNKSLSEITLKDGRSRSILSPKLFKYRKKNLKNAESILCQNDILIII